MKLPLGLLEEGIKREGQRERLITKTRTALKILYS